MVSFILDGLAAAGAVAAGAGVLSHGGLDDADDQQHGGKANNGTKHGNPLKLGQDGKGRTARHGDVTVPHA